MVLPPIFGARGDYVDFDSKEFQAELRSLAKEIDGCSKTDEIAEDAKVLAFVLTEFCTWKCSPETKANIMTLLASVKSACQRGLFPQTETETMLRLINSMSICFSEPENVIPTVESPDILLLQIMERFYPFLKLGNVLLSFEAKPNSLAWIKAFHYSNSTPCSQRVGLFVFRTEDISKSSCILHPQEVSFVLNGVSIEKRVNNISMDSGPQPPTDIADRLVQGTNLLQGIGASGGKYFVVVAFMDDIPLPDEPLLQDYVHSQVIESNSDCDVIEGSSRISLMCPISRTRIKYPVKGHVCKHLQCFDFRNYVKINMRTPSWRCPHCNQSVCYTDIRVDQKMIKILEEVGCNTVDVVISGDGSWKVVAGNENVELVSEHGDPSTFVSPGPTVLDLTRDETEMDTSGGIQVDEPKPCVADIQAPSNIMPSINALPQAFTTFDGLQMRNLPQVPNTRDFAARQATTFLPTSFSPSPVSHNPTMPSQFPWPQNPAQYPGSQVPAEPSRFAGSHNPARSSQFPGSQVPAQSSQYPGSNIPAQSSQFPGSQVPAGSFQFPGSQVPVQSAQYPGSNISAQSSQFQGSHIASLVHCLGRTPELMERWNHIGGTGTNHTQLPQIPPLQLQHHYGMQNQRPTSRSMFSVQQRQMPSSATHSQPSAVNYRRTPYQRPVQRETPYQRPVQIETPYQTPVQIGTRYQTPVQRPHLDSPVEQFISQGFMSSNPADTPSQRSQTRMRGSVNPGSGYDHMIIRPTRPVQAQAQTQTYPLPQPAAYSNNEIPACLASPSYLINPSYPIATNETQAGNSFMHVSENVGLQGLHWSMPPEAW